ncbi:hypothetical protein ACWGQT_07365 [Streptomyces yangpuensis]
MDHANGHELFHWTAPLQDHLGRFEESLTHAVEFYRGNDQDRAALAVQDMTEQLKGFMPGAPYGSLRAVARFMVEREAETLAGAQEAKETPKGCKSEECPGGPLRELLGHGPLGHRTGNALEDAGISTPEALVAKGWQYVLDGTRVGQKGFRLIQERVPGFGEPTT